MLTVSDGWELRNVKGSNYARDITHIECKRTHRLLHPDQDAINKVIYFHEKNKCKMVGPGERLKK